MRISRVGERYGQLVVISDDLGPLFTCRCDCGTEALYPRSISKPSSRHPRKCKECLAHPCEWCGKPVYKTNKATCSDACHKERNSHRERDRYYRVKDSPEWKAARADYLARLKARLESDPALKAAYASAKSAALKKWMASLRRDPERFSALLQQKRDVMKARNADPQEKQRRAEYFRRWYYTLSDDQYQRLLDQHKDYRHAKRNE